MMPRKTGTIWVVVTVQSGIPTSAEAFNDAKGANNREAIIRDKLNLDNDETGIFELRL
jgi:hypothetical protein